MKFIDVIRNILQRNAADRADRIREILVNHILIDTDRLEDLGTLVGLDRRDSHLGCDLDDAV